MKVRYLPEKNLPPYVFIPGHNPHPKKSGGHMEGEDDPIASLVDLKRPFESPFLRYALDLFNHGYYWESHVYFEALWNAHKRQGVAADFFKGMIKLGAAGVKMQLGQQESLRGHLIRAKELFGTVIPQDKNFMGFDLEQMISIIDEAILSHTMSFEIHPKWE